MFPLRRFYYSLKGGVIDRVRTCCNFTCTHSTIREASTLGFLRCALILPWCPYCTSGCALFPKFPQVLNFECLAKFRYVFQTRKQRFVQFPVVSKVRQKSKKCKTSKNNKVRQVREIVRKVRTTRKCRKKLEQTLK